MARNRSARRLRLEGVTVEYRRAEACILRSVAFGVGDQPNVNLAISRRGLRKLKEAAGKRFAGGVVLYDGEARASFGDAMHAVPIRALWEAL